MRLEQAREGMEAFEYLSLLTGLQQANALVTMPCDIGRYSTHILTNPESILQIRERIARAIVQLSGK